MRDFIASLFDNLGTKVVSLVMGLVLWVVVLGSRHIEVTKDVPIELITAPGVVTANEVPDHVTFRLSGPKAFLRGVIDRKEDPIRVNLSGAKPGIVTYRFFQDHLKVPSIGVKVLSVNPSNILVRLEGIKKREVPVKLNLRGNVPAGFKVGRAEVWPATVTISGAESKIESITEVFTAPVELSQIRRSSENEIGLDLGKQGVSLEGSLPKLRLDVVPLSANFKVKSVPVRVVSDFKSKVSPNVVTVLVRTEGPNSKILDRSQVSVFIDLTGKPRGLHSGLVPQVVVPSDVGFYKTIPERINVTLY